MRAAERVAASVVSWIGGGVEPANRSKIGMFDDDAPIWKFLERLGARDDPEGARTATSGFFLQSRYYGQTIALRSARFMPLAIVVPILVLAGGRATFAADEVHDEIQVYNAEIAAVGQCGIRVEIETILLGRAAPSRYGKLLRSNRLLAALPGSDSFAAVDDLMSCGPYDGRGT